MTLAAAGIISTANAQFATLHEFAGGNDDGRYPYGSLTLSGNTFYGMTSSGGSYNNGVVFRMDIDGSSYTNLHVFIAVTDDGAEPRGSLTLSGSTLYGMTAYGGDSDYGVIFKIDTDGSGYTNLHEFAGGDDDGRHPYGSLTLSGSTFYGMTFSGGDYNSGVIFKMDTDGCSYTNLYDFIGGSDDGKIPYGSLTLSGSTLYGMTYLGGDYNCGVIFKINTDGSNYTNLHEFAGGNDDGLCPYGSLTLSDSTLYGMTSHGGDSGYGVIFKIDTDGSSYTNLHEFAGGNDDGGNPHGSLTLSGSSLAGMTYAGGSNDYGVIFTMTTDGSNYTNLHSFAGGSGDGRRPEYGVLVEVAGYYYGMTSSGGTSHFGVVFKQLVPEPTVSVLAPIAAGLLLRIRKGY
jgi:uncharacterized repeat protein (TIGR03803 family)